MNAERTVRRRSSFIVHRSAFLLFFALACATPHLRRDATRTVGSAQVLDGNDDLIIHFHGASTVAFQAARGRTMAVVNPARLLDE